MNITTGRQIPHLPEGRHHPQSTFISGVPGAHHSGVLPSVLDSDSGGAVLGLVIPITGGILITGVTPIMATILIITGIGVTLIAVVAILITETGGGGMEIPGGIIMDSEIP